MIQDRKAQLEAIQEYAKKGGGPVTPVSFEIDGIKHLVEGMTKRELFAIILMHGYFTRSDGDWTHEEKAVWSVRAADVLLQKLGGRDENAA